MTIILQQHQQECFHKQGDKMNHAAHVDCGSRSKSNIINQIIEKSKQHIKIAAFEKFYFINPNFWSFWKKCKA